MPRPLRLIIRAVETLLLLHSSVHARIWLSIPIPTFFLWLGLTHLAPFGDIGTIRGQSLTFIRSLAALIAAPPTPHTCRHRCSFDAPQPLPIPVAVGHRYADARLTSTAEGWSCNGGCSSGATAGFVLSCHGAWCSQHYYQPSLLDFRAFGL